MDDYDLFSGDAPVFFSRHVDQAATERAWEYCCSLAHREVDDQEAVRGIWAAAGGDQQIVEAMAQTLEHDDGFRNDPLLAHVVAVAVAAHTGEAPLPLTGAAAETAAVERELINLPVPDAFRVLADRQPALHDVVAIVTAPGWVEQHRKSLSISDRLLGWVEDRLSLPGDIRTEVYGDWKPSEVTAASVRAEPAIREMLELLRPVFMASREDPIFRTKVAQLVCQHHLLAVSGAIPNWQP